MSATPPCYGKKLGEQTLQSPNGPVSTTAGNALASDDCREGSTSSNFPVDYLATELADAQRLLTYAAEAGIEVDSSIRTAVLKAQNTPGRWSEQTVDTFLAARTQLAKQLLPVTVESLKVCEVCADSTAAKTMRCYKVLAIILTLCILPYSLVSFVTSTLSEAIRRDLETANKLAVQLHSELAPLQAQTAPAAAQRDTKTLPQGVTQKEVLMDLQQFAGLIRIIDTRARQLHFFVLYTKNIADPFAGIRTDRAARQKAFELPTELRGHQAFYEAATAKIGVYQDVRYFAQSVQESVATWYGALATCLLPFFYALLGACAFLLRSFDERIKARTFTPSVVHVARLVTAGIGGAVVGLFSNFTITQSVSIPPLAIAFLVGYATDIFFSSLEGLLEPFNRDRTKADARGASSNGKR